MWIVWITFKKMDGTGFLNVDRYWRVDVERKIYGLHNHIL